MGKQLAFTRLPTGPHHYLPASAEASHGPVCMLDGTESVNCASFIDTRGSEDLEVQGLCWQLNTCVTAIPVVITTDVALERVTDVF